MKLSVLSPDSSEWSRHLNGKRHDAYHAPGYVELEAHRLGGSPLALLAEDGDRSVFLPLIVRSLPAGIGGNDAVSPYGYPGPLFSPDALGDEEFVSDAGSAICHELKQMACCAAFVRCHPLLPESPALFAETGSLRLLGPTVWINLGLSEEERWRQMSGKARQATRRTVLDGLTAAVDEDWSHFDEFLEIYGETMERAGANDWYYFDRSYFHQLREVLGQEIHLVIVERSGHVVAGSLFLESCGIVQAHLSGSKRFPACISPDRVGIDFAASWFGARGNEALHLGGGVGAESDSLLRFKRGFSNDRGAYRVWEIISDRSMYEDACSVLGTPGAEVGFFPPYRVE